MKKNYNMKRTISMKRFFSEFTENISDHMKQKLTELSTRCILTRKEEFFILDIKHVEHNKYDNSGMVGNNMNMSAKGKELVYGQFIMHDGQMYFSDDCLENADIIKSPIVETIYKSLDSEVLLLDDGVKAKKINDENIDCIVDSILKVCPVVSEKYTKIISKYSD